MYTRIFLEKCPVLEKCPPPPSFLLFPEFSPPNIKGLSITDINNFNVTMRLLHFGWFVVNIGVYFSAVNSTFTYGDKCHCLLLSVQEDPALTRWVYARGNPYAHFRPTNKTSLLGAMFGVVPLFALYYIFKTDRVWDKKHCSLLTRCLLDLNG